MNCNDESGGSRLDMAIGILREFNKWRRAEGDYAFNEADPSMNKPCPFTPEEIGKAIDYAVEFMESQSDGMAETMTDSRVMAQYEVFGDHREILIPEVDWSSTSDTILTVNRKIF